ncbi:MAG: Uma2 family endonuclease [Roseiflexaceae bacterium]|nr:Uma2 family endonuclease [Roseiflexus sp.]MDW8214633.1 Uma2 family endonuclease [Roseiflexaceae bacterium]
MTTETITRYRFTVDAYARLREAGVLYEDDRVELIDGEIREMSPVGARHVSLVNRLNALLVRLAGDSAIVSVQNPIRLDEYNEPQPDLALLRPREDAYLDALATPEDVLLVIEVADTSLAYDQQEKLPRYARAGIAEVWLVDAGRQIIEQYTMPVAGEYTLLHKILPGGRISAVMLPQVSFTTDALFSL